MDGFTAAFTAAELNARLSGGKIERITQPEKDTVILFVHAGGSTEKLLLCAAPSFSRAHTTRQEFVNPMNAPMFCMLLRKHLGGSKLTQISSYEGDRVLIFDFQCRNEMGDTVQRQLYLEMMGHHSNLTLVSGGIILDAVRHVTPDMSRVRQALPGLPFVMPPLQDNHDPLRCSAETLFSLLSSFDGTLTDALRARLRGISVRTAEELAALVCGPGPVFSAAGITPETANRLHELLVRLSAQPSPRVLLNDRGEPVDVLPFEYVTFAPEKQRPARSLSEAMDAVFSGRDRQDRIRQKSQSLRHILKNALEREEKKLALQLEEKAFGEKAELWRIYGELINAQLYLVPRGQDKVILPDLYSETGGTLEIPLDRALTPAQNAQRYFKRYRKARTAAQTASDQIETTHRSISLLENASEDLEKSETEDDLNDIRLVLTEAGYIRREHAATRKKQPESKPLSFLSPGGHTVLVGKNSVQNDRITLSGRAGDIWLHVKDIPGSHVLIRREDKPITDEDIEFAAKLAARYSSGKGHGVQVDYTDRKYVKKPSGAPRGFVTYTNQSSVYIA